jgi:hypothetical protein
MVLRLLVPLFALGFVADAGALERIALSDDRTKLVRLPGKQLFTPWGFN